MLRQTEEGDTKGGIIIPDNHSKMEGDTQCGYNTKLE